MRIVPAAPAPARPPSVPPARDHASSATIVCAALMLALAFLAFRIAGHFGPKPFPDCSFIGDSVEASCPTP
ncbi:hypothetical protein [Bradyrhizobium sp.]|jgi:hypothetical protein|uniref:hypothetical protein n=1 Tax=Bradyrhizobium sp. TaxID=376 RepID=UPI002D6B8DA4|nr:hypothetical protein [Bradyrhizobium sp.]HZR71330.1 hypothetical protein [Bradyrhizobium sp.]